MNRYLRCYAEISLEAIGHNIREVKKRLPEGVKLLGVVKANAYGHGAVPVASYLENQVDYFATATIEEAVELRENGISAPILILGYVSPSQYGDLVEYDITQTIDSYAQALALEKEAARQNRKAKAHLVVDTGMTRIGFQVTEHDADEAAKIADLPHIELEGMFTHFSCADQEDKTYCSMQMEKYDKMTALLAERGGWYMSAATMTAATVSRWMMGRNVSASSPFPTPCCAGGSGRRCCRWTENWKRPCSTAWTPNGAPSAGRCSPPAPTGPNTARNVPDA